MLLSLMRLLGVSTAARSLERDWSGGTADQTLRGSQSTVRLATRLGGSAQLSSMVQLVRLSSVAKLWSQLGS